MSLRDPKDVFATILDPSRRGKLYPYYHRLRELEPVHATDQLGPNRSWVLTSYRDINAVYRNRAMGSDQRNVALFDTGDTGKLFYDMMKRLLLYLDLPTHNRVRGLVSQAFTPRSVDERRPRMQAVVDELLDRAADEGRMDLVADFAYLLPVTVICEMMGIPPEDLSQFYGWAHDFARRGDVSDITAERVAAGEEATRGFTDYFLGFIRERRLRPQPDLISALVEVHDEAGGLSDDEIVASCVILLQAGHETTADLIGMGTLHLLEHPDELRLLREDPSLIGSAVEELLRYDSSVQIAQRVGPEDIVLGGVTVPAGEVCVLLNGAANRDPGAFPDPDRLDVSRAGQAHVSFGLGNHHCLGASLARAEITIALGTLIDRFPKLALATDCAEFRPSLFLRGLAALPVTLS
jgi:cytochrome P450